MKVREAGVWDFPWLLEMAKDYAEEVGGYGGIRYDADKAAQMAAWTVSNPGGAILLVERDRRPVGLLWALVGPFMPWSSDVIAYDYILYVEPGSRGTLAGPLLIRAYRKWAVAQGASVVNLSIASGINQERTSRLFRHEGFEPIANQARYYHGHEP